MAQRAWYTFVLAAAQTEADLYLFGLIGSSFWDDAVSARQFVADLAALPDSVKVLHIHVSSPGGNFFDGIAMANTLRAQSNEKGRRVETIIEGLAGSAATLVTSAGDVVKIAENATMFVHNPIGLTFANAKTHRKTADLLDGLAESIVATYRWHSKLEPAALRALMDEETWMSAEEAVANGFATEIIQAMPVEASIDPRILAHLSLQIPDRFRATIEALTVKPAPTPVSPSPAAPAEVLAAVEAAGLSTGFARTLIEAAVPMTEVQRQVDDAKGQRTAEESRAAEIRALCVLAKAPQLAESLVRSGMAIADVKAHLSTVKALTDQAEIDTGLAPDAARAAGRTVIDVTAIYRDRAERAERARHSLKGA